MSTKTITQSGALLRAHLAHKPGGDLGIAVRFCDARLKQLRRTQRRERCQLLVLKLRRFFSRP